MPRHTIHEVAVNAKLTIARINELQNEDDEEAMTLVADLSDEAIIGFGVKYLLDRQYDLALFVSAILAERRNYSRLKAEIEYANSNREDI